MESGFGFLVRHNLAIDLFLSNPARDELGNLGAEVDDQNLVVHGRRCFPNVPGIGCARPFGAAFCGLCAAGSSLSISPSRAGKSMQMCSLATGYRGSRSMAVIVQHGAQ